MESLRSTITLVSDTITLVSDTITLVSDTITLVGGLGHNIPNILFCSFFVVVADY